MKLLTIAAIGLGLTVMPACGADKELSRAKAKELIAQELKKRQPVPVVVPIGTIAVGAAGKYANLEQALADPNPFNRYRKFLIDNGLLEAKWIGPSLGFNMIEFSLTPKAKPYLIDEFDKNPMMRGCDPQVQEVTGVSTVGPGGSFATAEYTWTVANMTLFGKGYREIAPNTCEPTIRTDSMHFQRFDDGWRIRN